MTPEEYAHQQAAIVAMLVLAVNRFVKPFQEMAMGQFEWLTLLELIFPHVEEARRQSSHLGRRFFDAQRGEHLPGAPRHDVDLAPYSFESFVKDMEPARRRFQFEDATDHDAGQIGLLAARVAENAGRRTIIRAVETDDYPDTHPETGTVRGWARVATGRETCSWCLMLVSRGPVYQFASTAGLNTDDDTAADMVAQGEDITPLMNQWHAGCDCKVVPVYDKQNWVGRDEADRALELWNQIQDEAQEEWEALSPEERERTSYNRLALNALRRLIERGDVDLSIFGTAFGTTFRGFRAAA